MASESTTYADDIQHIQDIIQRLSEKNCDIDKMLAYVQEATSLIEKCNEKLNQTGLKIDEAVARLKTTMT